MPDNQLPPAPKLHVSRPVNAEGQAGFTLSVEFTPELFDLIFDVPTDDPELNRLYAQTQVVDRWNRLAPKDQLLIAARLAELAVARLEAEGVEVSGSNEPKPQ